MKQELSKKAKLSVFKTVFDPIFTYGNDSFVLFKVIVFPFLMLYDQTNRV